MADKRIEYAIKNFAWGSISNILTALLGFISRTVFIYTLGETYLGVNGLFGNLLGVLSLAELGIASAVCFSLYKPMAEKNIRKIQAIVNFYRNAYRMVAAVVAGIGLAMLPFLEWIVKDTEGVENLRLIYGIFLFNTVTSYLLTYKTTLLQADQKIYLHTNITIVVQIITTVLQMVVLLVWRNFIAYLLIGAVVQLCSKVYINWFVNEQYPFLKVKNREMLSFEERKEIFTKIRALVVHKIGDISINQTDNIITTACVNITAVGLVSNFVMIIDMIKNFILMIFNSALAGLGNVLAVEDEETKVRVSYYYDFLGFCFFGWSALVLFFCLTPFITLWLGESRLIDNVTVALLCINYYVMGSRVPFGNVRTAAGAFEYDKWVPFAQAVTNVVVSIVGANLWGLKGIYIGTLVSSLFPTLTRPYVVHKYVFHRKSGKYFCRYFLRMVFLLAVASIVAALLKVLTVANPYVDFLLTAAISALVPLGLLVLVYGRTDAFRYFWGMFDSMILCKFRRG